MWRSRRAPRSRRTPNRENQYACLKAFPGELRAWREYLARFVSPHELKGVLRLRGCFASQSIRFAQDDRVIFSASCVGSTLSSKPSTFCTTTFSPADTSAEATASQ